MEGIIHDFHTRLLITLILRVRICRSNILFIAERIVKVARVNKEKAKLKNVYL